MRCRYLRLTKNSRSVGAHQHLDFLQTGDARAAVVKVAAAADMQYVAAVDSWGFVCIWDHRSVIASAMPEQSSVSCSPVVARWKVCDGPVLDIQFVKQHGRTCVLLLLPPATPSSTNVPSLFTINLPSAGSADGCVGELVAYWMPHPSDAGHCLCIVDPSTSNPASLLESKSRAAEVTDGQVDSAEEGDEVPQSPAASLAILLNSTM